MMLNTILWWRRKRINTVTEALLHQEPDECPHDSSRWRREVNYGPAITARCVDCDRVFNALELTLRRYNPKFKEYDNPLRRVWNVIVKSK